MTVGRDAWPPLAAARPQCACVAQPPGADIQLVEYEAEIKAAARQALQGDAASDLVVFPKSIVQCARQTREYRTEEPERPLRRRPRRMRFVLDAPPCSRR